MTSEPHATSHRALKISLVGLTLLTATQLSACGQKGPLYLPNASTKAPASATSAPAPHTAASAAR